MIKQNPCIELNVILYFKNRCMTHQLGDISIGGVNPPKLLFLKHTNPNSPLLKYVLLLTSYEEFPSLNQILSNPKLSISLYDQVPKVDGYLQEMSCGFVELWIG